MVDDRVQMDLRPSVGRRVLATAALTSSGGALIWAAADTATISAVARGSLTLLGLGLLVLAVALWRATATGLKLTGAGLHDERGRLLARMEDIVSVGRGALSLAPSGGFVLRLAAPATEYWAPGLWWRAGTSLGIGGTTPRLQTREMGLLIEAMVASRKKRLRKG